MIVLDASAVVEMLTHRAMGATIEDALVEAQDEVIVPHLLDVEATNALRNLAMGGKVDADTAAAFLEALPELRAARQAHTELLPRVWELRHNFTPYDAIYIALAEMHGATLWTCDAKMMKGHRAKVLLFRPQ